MADPVPSVPVMSVTSPFAARPGLALPQVSLRDVTIVSAWNVQGRAIHAEVERRFGIALPEKPNTLASTGSLTAIWLGPASWLLVTGAAPLTDFAASRDALNAAGGALFDVSASRVAWQVGGPRAADVLAAGCPLDFDARVFTPGRAAQSVYGRVAALYCRCGDAPSFLVLAARGFGREVGHHLHAAAAEYGLETRPAVAWPAT